MSCYCTYCTLAKAATPFFSARIKAVSEWSGRWLVGRASCDESSTGVANCEPETEKFHLFPLSYVSSSIPTRFLFSVLAHFDVCKREISYQKLVWKHVRSGNLPESSSKHVCAVSPGRGKGKYNRQNR